MLIQNFNLTNLLKTNFQCW